MTAGRGVIHSEIPQQEQGVMEGFQLWLNLPAADKLCAPWYRDFVAAELPRFTATGVIAIVLAGHSHGVTGAVTRDATAPLYLDLRMKDGSRFEQSLPADHNAFVYVYRGAVRIGDSEVPAGRMAILANAGDGVVIDAPADARLILVAGRPLGEPIAQHGPFVMNTPAEIQQALADYRAGRLA
jgi:redox-sensitive bicupin YhaK (pirin superfamily)